MISIWHMTLAWRLFGLSAILFFAMVEVAVKQKHEIDEFKRKFVDFDVDPRIVTIREFLEKKIGQSYQCLTLQELIQQSDKVVRYLNVILMNQITSGDVTASFQAEINSTQQTSDTIPIAIGKYATALEKIRKDITISEIKSGIILKGLKGLEW